MTCTTSPCASFSIPIRSSASKHLPVVFLPTRRFTSPPKHHRLFWFNDNQDLHLRVEACHNESELTVSVGAEDDRTKRSDLTSS